MLEVKINDKNNFEKAMRQFKKQCQKDGFLVELKERRFYSKPSDKKRKKGTGGRQFFLKFLMFQADQFSPPMYF